MLSRKTKPVTILVTKKLAKEFSELDGVPNDRELSERRLMVYQRLIVAGDFHACVWAKVFCKETGATYRINGKHTSVVLAGLEKTPEFWVTVESFECTTLQEAAELYAQFDSQIQSRTARDIYLSFAGTVPGLRDARLRRLICKAVPGMAYAKWQGESQRKPPAERAEILLDDPDFIIWAASIFAGRSSDYRKLDRAPVIAVMFMSWKKSQSAANEFWCAVRDETGDPPSVPDRQLAKFLLRTRMASTRGSSSVAHVTSRQMFVTAIRAWNSWRDGSPFDLRYFAAAKVPAVR